MEGKVRNVVHEDLPAEKTDQKVLSDTGNWNPLEKLSVEIRRANVRSDFI